MGDSATAMRDPVFYRWHAYIDDIFLLYKNKLPPYPQNKVSFTSIQTYLWYIKWCDQFWHIIFLYNEY